MIILSNSLTDKADEGGLKLASSIVKRLKNKNKDIYVIAYDRQSELSDVYLKVNKFLLNKELFFLLKKRKQEVLYIPFPAPTFNMALRIMLLSLMAKKGLKVIMVRQYPMSNIARILLSKSRAELIVFSKSAKCFYSSIVNNRVCYIKTGVDINKFKPVSVDEQRQLKERYGFDTNKPIILHVGHLKEGRNIAELMKISGKYNVLLVVSTLSKERQSGELREKLKACDNITIMDEYIANIEEIYQMCDAYFFPVVQEGHCIDVPLSCLEASACNKPVITTRYGEMKEFINCDGFYFIDKFDTKTINDLIDMSLEKGDCCTRDYVVKYDWDEALRKIIGEEND